MTCLAALPPRDLSRSDSLALALLIARNTVSLDILAIMFQVTVVELFEWSHESSWVLTEPGRTVH